MALTNDEIIILRDYIKITNASEKEQAEIRASDELAREKIIETATKYAEQLVEIIEAQDVRIAEEQSSREFNQNKLALYQNYITGE